MKTGKKAFGKKIRTGLLGRKQNSKISRIGITGRKQNPIATKTAMKAIKLLEEKGVKAEVDISFLPKTKNCKKLSSFTSNIVLSFGGDGTLLQVFRDLKRKIPVIGINCGNVGFLQAYDHKEIEKAVSEIIAGKFKVRERTRISAKVDGKKVHEALNEVLIVPRKAGRILKYHLSVGSEGREEAGDGLIVATPTGSTAHALSAGGPVVKGNAAVFVIVSINPVDWKNRPLIINDHEKVAVSGFTNSKPEVVIDGQKRFTVRKKAELVKGSKVLLGTRD